MFKKEFIFLIFFLTGMFIGNLIYKNKIFKILEKINKQLKNYHDFIKGRNK